MGRSSLQEHRHVFYLLQLVEDGYIRREGRVGIDPRFQIVEGRAGVPGHLPAES